MQDFLVRLRRLRRLPVFFREPCPQQPGAGVPGIHAGQLLKMLFRLGRVPLAVVQCGKIIQGRWLIGIQGERGLIGANRFLHGSQLAVHQGQIELSVGGLRINFHGFQERGFCRLRIVPVLINDSQIKIRLREVGVKGDGLFQMGDGLLRLL